MAAKQLFEKTMPENKFRAVDIIAEDADGDLDVTRDINVGRDATAARDITAGRHIVASGNITATGDIVCDDITADAITSGSTVVTAFAIGAGTPSGTGAAIPDAAGGAVVDVEARAAINALLAQLRVTGGKGFIAD